MKSSDDLSEPSPEEPSGGPAEGRYEPIAPTFHFTREGTFTDLILIVAPRGGGKTTLMASLAGMVPNERLEVVSPVPRLGELRGILTHRKFASDKDIADFWGSYLRSGKRVVIFVDEGDEYITGSVQGGSGGYCCDELYRLVNYGRNDPWAIGMVWSCRGASDVTTNLIRAANVSFIGQTLEPNAVEYLGRYMGSLDWRPYLHALPRYVFVVHSEGVFCGYVKVEGGEITWVDPPGDDWPLPENRPPISATGSDVSEDVPGGPGTNMPSGAGSAGSPYTGGATPGMPEGSTPDTNVPGKR